MTLWEIQKCIKKTGLERSHNAIARMAQSTIETKESGEILTIAQEIIEGLVNQYGKDYRATAFILYHDGSAQFLYNTYEGYTTGKKGSVNAAKKFANQFSRKEDYVLIVETEPNKYEIITQELAGELK